MSEDDSSVLIILLETYRGYWNLLQNQDGGTHQAPSTAESIIDQLLTFVRAFLLVSESNKVAIFAVHHDSSPLLFSSAGLAQDQELGSSRQFPAVEIRDRIGKLIGRSGRSGAAASEDGPVLAGAISRVLCLLHAARRRAPAGREAPRKARVLCVQASPDVSAQYIAFMNAIFSAQRNDAVIDACMVGGLDSSLLQQACHLTGGIYTRPRRPGALLQHLLAVYVGDTETRSLLMLPQSHGVDFRASCFCHKRAISLGFVCSVCLSIFCESLQECSTCGTVFPASDAGSKRRGTPAPQAQSRPRLE